MLRIIYLICGVLLLTLLPGNGEKIVLADEGKKLVAYYAAWSPPENLDANLVTHINFAFADVCWDGMHGNPEVEVADGEQNVWECTDLAGNDMAMPNGSIVLGDVEGDLESFMVLEELKEENPSLKTLISIGGWSWSNNLSLVAGDEVTREVFAASAVDFVREFGFDGVDLNWSFPVEGGMPGNHYDSRDKRNHTLLLEEVRAALDLAGEEDGKEYLLTIASNATISYLENNELAKIAELVDHINMMTYDFNGAWSPTASAHNAPLYDDAAAKEMGVYSGNVTAAVDGHLNAGVPKDKLVVGVPFYGRSWGGCTIMDFGGYFNCKEVGGGNLEPGVYDYRYLAEHMIGDTDFKRRWNDVAKVPFLVNEATGEMISYDDAESLLEKTDYILEQGLAGAMVWELSQDDVAGSLLHAVALGVGLVEGDPAELLGDADLLDEAPDASDSGKAVDEEDVVSGDRDHSTLSNVLIVVGILIFMVVITRILRQNRKNA